MFLQIVSVAGAALILLGYVLNLRGAFEPDDRLYALMNLLGALLLLWVAIVDRRVGFIVLEGAWALVSIPTLLGLRRARSTR